MPDKPTYEELLKRIQDLEEGVVELKMVEESPTEREKWFLELIEAIPDAIYFKDTENRYLFVNKAFEKIVDKRREDIIGKLDKQLLPAGLSEQAESSDKEILRKLEPVRYEQYQTDNKGETTFFDTLKFPVFDSHGSIKGLGGVSRDITHNKQVEEALRKSKSRYGLIFNGSRDAIFITDADAKFTDVNDAASVLTGYSKAELKRMSIPDLHEKVDLHAFETYFESIMAGEPVVSEAKILRRDGVKVDTEFSNTRIEISGIPFMHTVAKDITDRKQAEKALKQAHDELERRVKERSVELWKANERLKESEEHFR